MEANKRLSVIVPIYNSEKYLDRCIDSIVSQIYTNLEIILVDDGSTDASGEICDKWATRDNRIVVHHKSNCGLVAARQTGVSLASADYVAYVDSDDWIESDMYEEMMACVKDHHPDIVCSGIINDYETYYRTVDEAITSGIYELNQLQNLVFPNLFTTSGRYRANVDIHLVTKIFSKNLLERHQFNLSLDTTMGEDVAVSIPCILDSSKIVFTGKSYYHYMIRTDSMTSVRSGLERSVAAVMQQLYNACDKHVNVVNNIREQIRRYYNNLRVISDTCNVFEVINGELYPFKNLCRDDRVILYGFGRVGKELYRYNQDNNFCDIVAICDTDSAQEGVITVDEAVAEYDFDKIVISVLNFNYVDEIYNNLVSLGVPKDKIIEMEL